LKAKKKLNKLELKDWKAHHLVMIVDKDGFVTKVTQWRAKTMKCPRCGKEATSHFPLSLNFHATLQL